MAYVINENRLGQTLIGSIDAKAAVPIGTIVTASDPVYGFGEFIYLTGVASTVLGSWVTINMDDGSTTLLAANAIGPVGVAMAPTVANTYGWYQITGKAIGRVLAGYLDNALVYGTATAGSVDDAAVAGDLVFSAKGASATGVPGANLAEFEISRPFTTDV